LMTYPDKGTCFGSIAISLTTTYKAIKQTVA
jgi:hypothetical protein